MHETLFRKMLPAVRQVPSPGFNVSLGRSHEDYLFSFLICELTDDDKTLVLASLLNIAAAK